MSTGAGEYDDTIDPGDIEDAREEFIKILKSQYRSRGQIKGTDTYYSQWYVGGIYSNGWNAKTPWCACYISWALNEMGADIKQPESRKATDHLGNPYYKWFANVDDFMEYFNPTPTQSDTWIPGGGTPKPGDLIFFDWNKGKNPQHVGVVLKVDDRMVYTIEGNSAGRVTVRSYPVSDDRIIGYGVVFLEPAA
jgi:cell wall-associated NlpC family hydrolase